jgi:hypothetical protein
LHGDNPPVRCGTFEESGSLFVSPCLLRSVGWGSGNQTEAGTLGADRPGGALYAGRGAGGVNAGGLATRRGGGIGRRGSGSLGDLSGVRGRCRGGWNEERGGDRGGGGRYGGRPRLR